MTITDEMVEKAWEAWHDNSVHGASPQMRAALEAVAPMLIAQGMWEAAKIAVGAHDPRQMTWAEKLLAIHERAHELDPK